jgi:hypothetical protein
VHKVFPGNSSFRNTARLAFLQYLNKPLKKRNETKYALGRYSPYRYRPHLWPDSHKPENRIPQALPLRRQQHPVGVLTGPAGI